MLVMPDLPADKLEEEVSEGGDVEVEAGLFLLATSAGASIQGGPVVDELRADPGRGVYVGLVEALVQVMGMAKRYLLGHGPQVAMLAARLADHLGVPVRERSEILFAAILSDVGMIGLAEEAWENPVLVLPPDIRSRVLEHPERSERSVKQIAHLSSLAPLVRHHHEWWDGTGYPDGLEGDEIPVGAQILRLADTVVALGTARPQRGPLSTSEILTAVIEGSWKEFGPAVAEAYLALARTGRLPVFHDALFQRACLDAASELIPEEVSPLSTQEFLDIVATLIEAKDPYTAGHSRRVANLAAALTERMGLNAQMRETTWEAGYLHDLGKVSVPLRVLTKDGPLDDEERLSIQAHAAAGADILGAIPGLNHLSPGCRYHHERWDGQGYPEGLSGDDIPIVAQILGVCDTYDAMTSSRVYRAARSHQDALDEIARSSGTQFGPRIAEDFVQLPSHVFEDMWAGVLRESPSAPRLLTS